MQRVYKYRVSKIGAFWKTSVFYNGAWITLRGLYMTREQARIAGKNFS